MAETVAITAAAAQFLDIGGRALFSLSRLCSDLQHVPKKMKRAQRDMGRLLDLIRRLKHDLEAQRTGPASTLRGVIPSDQLDMATTWLEECIRQVNQLNQTLNGIVSEHSDNFVRKGWCAVVAVKKQREILDDLNGLEHMKSSLDLWYQHETLELMSTELLTSERTWNLVQEVDRKVSPVGGQLTGLKDDIRRSNHLLQRSIEETGASIKSVDREMSQVRVFNQSMQSDVEQTAAGVRSLDGEMSKMHQKLEEVSSNVHATHDSVQTSYMKTQAGHAILHRIENRFEALHQDIKERDTTSQITPDNLDRLADEIVVRLVSKPGLAHDLLTDSKLHKTNLFGPHARQKTRKYRAITSCSCHASCSVSRISWPPVQLYSERGEQHQPYCPSYPRSQISWTLGVQAVMPRLLGRSISLAFRATWGAGGFGLFPALNTIRVIDRRASPAIAEIEAACAQVNEHSPWLIDTKETRTDPSVVDKVRLVLENLYAQLAMQFHSGRASGYDQDEHGTTLLHEFVGLVNLISIIQEYLMDPIDQIIKLLVEYGVDVNAVSERYGERGGALAHALNGSAIFLQCGSFTLEEARRIKIPLLLVRNGGYLTDPSSLICTFRRGENVIKWLRDTMFRNPEFASDFGCSEVNSAVIRRSESDLRRLLSFPRHVDDCENEISTPLMLAVGWPEGTKILLEAGADTGSVIILAIILNDVDAVTMLLDHGCRLFDFTRAGDQIYTTESVLGVALIGPSTEQIIRLIVRAIAEQRRHLLCLARKELSEEDLGSLPLPVLTGATLLDKDAVTVARSLQRIGTTIPDALYPGSCSGYSIYHLPAMTVQAATCLYDCGFRCIDERDSSGRTPALIQCFFLSFEMISWFLAKGAALHGFGPNLPTNMLHALAVAFPVDDWYKPSLSDWEKGLSPCDRAVLERISSACGPTSTDGCVCFCSSSGCTPITLLCKDVRRSGGWSSQCTRLKLWLQGGNVTPSLAEACYAEFCRLEIFQRLGMAHTCCHYLIDCCFEKREVDLEEQQELREEDADFEIILDAYMKLYKQLRIAHSGSFSLFWEAWWEALSSFLPEKKLRYNGYGWDWDEESRWEGSDEGDVSEQESEIEGNREVEEGEDLVLEEGEGLAMEEGEGLALEEGKEDEEIRASYGLDGQIKLMVQARLKYKGGEDYADIFKDSMECLFS